LRKKFAVNSEIVQAISDTIELSEKRSGTMVMQNINVDDILLDDNNPRELQVSISDVKQNRSFPGADKRALEFEAIASLSKSIKENGLINPVLVYKEGKKYRLIAGERRTLATHLAKLTTIAARILPGKPEKSKISILQWAENIERSSISLWEKMKNINSILEFTGAKLTSSSLSDLLGCSRATGGRYCELLKIREEDILDKIRGQKINSVEKAVLISKKPRHERALIYKGIESGAINRESLKKKISKERKSTPPKKQLCADQGGGMILHLSSLGIAKTVYQLMAKDEKLAMAANLVVEPDWSNEDEARAAFIEISQYLKEVPL
jgi:ParB family transcriptional regulator, chromosome partitioning protein